MSSAQPPSPDDDQAQDASRDNDSVVTPPSYPAYSTPPPEGLPDAEHG
ncbi:MAG: hypothetical protein JO082_05320 [Mycobacterium sp.]|nr:hypothetical protein [Mycobacterium sp.]MBV9721320.1 hypothetical protein [Mycobacterium sp.]